MPPHSLNMNICETLIPGCFEIELPCFADARGTFVKAANRSAFAGLRLETGFVETIYSVSEKDVMRGMHFQLPPADQAKYVFCVSGSVMDVALDLRRGSPSYGLHCVMELSAARHNAAYLPKGVAHGFCVRSAPAILCYLMTREYAPELDAGVAWDSFGAPWPVKNPVLSARDAALPALRDFASPFRYRKQRVLATGGSR